MLATVSSTCKNLHYIALLALLCSPAWAAVNLPLTCTGTLTSSGTCSSANRVFALPGPTTLVAVGATYKPFASTAEQVLVCALDIPSPTPTAGCATASKIYVDKCAVAGANCAGKNTVTLRWTAPAKNADDSALTDLAGYKVYSGTSPDTLTLLKTLADPAAKTVSLPGYGAGKYYFALTAYNAKAAESARSEVKFADFPAPQTKPGPVSEVTITAP